MESLDQAHLINDGISILLGIALSSACGFRVFVPFLMLSLVGVLNWWSLPSGLTWLDSPEALIVLAVASGLEVIAYGIPWLDNFLDLIAIPVAALAGMLLTATVLPPDMQPLVQWTLAVIAGGGSAGIINSVTNLSRLTTTATTGGLANWGVSGLELLAAAILPLLALHLPVIIGGMICLVLLGGLVWLGRFLFLKLGETQKPRVS